METVTIALLIGLGLSAFTVFADALIKKASLGEAFSGWPLLLAGALIYGCTALGWFFVMRKVKLSTLGALYGVSCVVLVVLVGVIFFREELNRFEILGLLLAAVSLLLLARFA